MAVCLYEYAILQADRNHQNCSNKIKMPKNITAYRIKSLRPIENMNVEKLWITKSTPTSLTKSVLDEFKKAHLLWAFIFIIIFVNF